MPIEHAALEAPTKTNVYLVQFTYGTETVRYTNAHQDEKHLGATFTSIPTLSVKIPEFTGGIQEDDFIVNLPRANTFAREIASGEAVPRVRMIVREKIDTRNHSHVDILHDGIAQVVTSNADGKADRYRFSSKTIKQRLDIKMGVPATITCQHTFGLSSDCGIDETALQESVTITRVNPGGLVVTVASVTASTPWTGGYLSLDGLRISIRDYAGADEFALKVPPPPRWQGRTVVATPGCRKSWEACGFDWANQEQFLGLGVAIPDYHPLVEGA